MPQTKKEDVVSDKKLHINIDLARNGCVVSACPLSEDEDGKVMHDYENEMAYVYDSIEEMVKELPSFISVLKEQSGLNSPNPTKHEADMGNKKEGEQDMPADDKEEEGY